MKMTMDFTCQGAGEEDLLTSVTQPISPERLDAVTHLFQCLIGRFVMRVWVLSGVSSIRSES